MDKPVDSEGKPIVKGQRVTYPHPRGGFARDYVEEVWTTGEVRLRHGGVYPAERLTLGTQP